MLLALYLNNDTWCSCHEPDVLPSVSFNENSLSIEFVKLFKTQGCKTGKASLIEECALSLCTFSCLHIAPETAGCRVQSQWHNSPWPPLMSPPPSCLNLSLPVSTHFLARNFPVVNIHSFSTEVLSGRAVNGSEQPWTNTQYPWDGSGGGEVAQQHLFKPCQTSLQGSQCSHIVSLLICSTTSPAGNEARVK